MGYFDTADPTIKPKINTHETAQSDFSRKAAQTGPGETFHVGLPQKLREEFVTKDSGERKTFASGMQRDTAVGKLLWHLVAFGPMLRRWVSLLTRGAIKYDENNWMKANGHEELERFRASAYRHFMQWFYGDEPEEDHAAAVFFNVNGAEYVKDKLKNSIKVPITEGPERGTITGRLGVDPTESHDSYARRRAESFNALIIRHQKERKDFEQWQNEKTNGNLGGARA